MRETWDVGHSPSNIRELHGMGERVKDELGWSSHCGLICQVGLKAGHIVVVVKSIAFKGCGQHGLNLSPADKARARGVIADDDTKLREIVRKRGGG